jgi:tetratricopeptide (TPR) repeat protein
MSAQPSFVPIESLIKEGRLEEAIEALVAILDADPRFEALARAARVNQADLARITAQYQIDAISATELRQTSNKITNNILGIMERAEKGQFDLNISDEAPHKQRWRYYAIGAAVALLGAFLTWYFLRKKEDCPSYAQRITHRVMIIPFRETGEKKSGELAIDIADGLSVKINRTKRLKDMAEVAVLEKYQGGYPSPQQAEIQAQHCDVQMIVWGKINQSEDKNYKLDVRYRLLKAGQVLLSGDTSLNNLIKSKDEGHLIQDLENVTELLYLVLANNAQVPVEPSALASLYPSEKTDVSNIQNSHDTTLLMLVAENQARMGRYDKAIETYDQIIALAPSLAEARQKRGALLYEKGEYVAAVADFNAAAPTASKASHDLLKTRTEAALKGGLPKNAEADLKALSLQKVPGDSAWIQQKQIEVRDSINSLKKQRDDFEKKAKSSPNNTKITLKAAQTNLALEEPERALKIVSKTVKDNPENQRAGEIALAALLMKKDTLGAQKLINAAEKKGVELKAPGTTSVKRAKTIGRQ